MGYQGKAMKSISKDTQIVGFILVVLVGFLDACCTDVRFQNSFCTADWVIKAQVDIDVDVRVITRTINIGDGETRTVHDSYEYSIRILEVFKEPPELIEPGHAILHTKALDCGVYLTRGFVYYLTGTMVDGQMHISGCDAIREESSISETILEGITSLYQPTCSHCWVSSAAYRPEWATDNKVCAPTETKTEEDYYCGQARDGSCSWHQISDLEDVL